LRNVALHLPLQQELLLRPMDKTVYFMPSYVIGEEKMDMLVKNTITVIGRACLSEFRRAVFAKINGQ